MSHPFLISALPRSRTAWLSVFFTYYPNFCLHEGLAKYGTVESLLRAANAAPGPVGNSDSSLTLKADDVIFAAEHGLARVAVIDRPLEEVRPSLTKYYAGSGIDQDKVLGVVVPGHERIRDSGHALVVKYDDLNKEETVRELFDHLLPGQQFPAHWYNHLRLLRVNQILDVALEAQLRGNS